MGDFPLESVIKGGVGGKQSFFQEDRGYRRKTVIFSGAMRYFCVKPGYNYTSIVFRSPLPARKLRIVGLTLKLLLFTVP